MKTIPIIASLFFLLFALAAAPLPPLGADERQSEKTGSQADIPELTDFASLQAVFNQDTGQVRLVALLSPSCGYCIKGYRYMRKILDEVPDERLKMYVVWEPMLSGDSKELAERMSRKAKDPRMIYQAWDNERLTGETWKEVLNLESTAWDVYFLYEADATWEEEGPTTPTYWQHQGASNQADQLDYDKLKQRIETMLANTG